MNSASAAAVARLKIIAQSRQVVFGQEQGSVGVQNWIATSWQRCLNLGYEPQHRVAFDPVSPAAERRSRAANRELAQAAQSTLQQLATTIAPTGYFVILTNAHGVVVASSGNIDRQDQRATQITRVGVDLSERAIRTSAIGAALAEQADVWLHRGEHFFDDTSAYSCAGSPIFNGSGRCVGMLDVTGIDVPERPELIHMVSSAARCIENQLVLNTPHSLVIHLRWPGTSAIGREAEGLLCMSDDGHVCAMNRTARQMVGSGLVAGKPHASDFFPTDWRRLFDANLSETALLLPLWSGLIVMILTSRNGQLEPLQAMMPVVDTRVRQSVGSLKAHQAEVIRDTVTQLKGNVAAAAAKLGISRATVYRKLRSGHS